MSNLVIIFRMITYLCDIPREIKMINDQNHSMSNFVVTRSLGYGHVHLPKPRAKTSLATSNLFTTFV
jgi:hypothetical protein